MGITPEIIKSKVSSNPNITNAQIAREIITEFNLDPFLAENYRKKISKIRNTPTFNIIIEKKVTEIVVKKKLNILVVGDLHTPYCHKDYLNFNIELRNKYNVDKIIFIGDIVDNHSTSYHEHNPNLSSPKDELDKAKEMLSDWYREFPNANVMMGNHDMNFARKIFTAGLPTDVMKPFNEILGLNNWKFVDEEIVGNNYFTHGTKLSSVTIKEKALKLQKNVICGHLHSESYIRNITQNIWVSHIGCGVDFNSANFNYAKGGSKEPILSSLVILDNQPILITM